MEEFYTYTNPLYWLVESLRGLLFLIAFLLGIIWRPIRREYLYQFVVKKYTDEECEKAIQNLNRFYHSDTSKMSKDHKRTYDYCTERLK